MHYVSDVAFRLSVIKERVARLTNFPRKAITLTRLTIKMPFTGFLDILCEYFDVSFQVLPM
jgi:hypothetical protein